LSEAVGRRPDNTSLKLKIARMEKRIVALSDWLAEKFPQIFEEQRHLDKGSVERYYWHYGYLIALRDNIKLLKRERAWFKEEGVG